jgi:dienelactone hydrolase
MRAAFLIFILSALAGCGGNTASSISNSSQVNQTTANNSANSATIAATSQTVTVDSPDGVKIVGSLFESAKPNSPAVLLLHQWQSDRHSYDDFAKRLQAKGFTVLSIDGRGFGDSTKKADGTVVTAGRSETDVKAMLGDVSAAFEFLLKQKNVDPSRVGIVGASYGSSLAIIYAADHPNVKAVALLSPGLNYFGNMPIEPAVREYGPQRPLLLAAAKDDPESDDTVNSIVGHMANDAKWEFLSFPSGGHGTALFKVGLGDSLEKFLVEQLQK